MTKTKVLLSIDEDDLAKIDELAAAADMSRSAYLVAMGRQGPAGVFDAIAQLRAELERFEHKNQGPADEVRVLEERVKELTLQNLEARAETSQMQMHLAYATETAARLENLRNDIADAVDKFDRQLDKLSRVPSLPQARKLSQDIRSQLVIVRSKLS
jgi:uncharacterized protein YhaN